MTYGNRRTADTFIEGSLADSRSVCVCVCVCACVGGRETNSGEGISSAIEILLLHAVLHVREAPLPHPRRPPPLSRIMTVFVRPFAPGDLPALLDGLYPAAFPDEDLVPLVRALHQEAEAEAADADVVCSLVAVEDTEGLEGRGSGERIVGNVVFTSCKVRPTPDGTAGDDRRDGDGGTTDDVALLGPLCVAPSRQGRGCGSLLVRGGVERMREAGKRRILVLGSPAYYGRFGFRTDGRIRPPYPLPRAHVAAWQSLNLSGGMAAGPEDRGGGAILVVPKPWQDGALWG